MQNDPPDADEAPTPRETAFHAKVYQLLEYDRLHLAGPIVIRCEQKDGKMLQITNIPDDPEKIKSILNAQLVEGAELKEISEISEAIES